MTVVEAPGRVMVEQPFNVLLHIRNCMNVAVAVNMQLVKDRMGTLLPLGAATRVSAYVTRHTYITSQPHICHAMLTAASSWYVLCAATWRGGWSISSSSLHRSSGCGCGCAAHLRTQTGSHATQQQHQHCHTHIHTHTTHHVTARFRSFASVDRRCTMTPDQTILTNMLMQLDGSSV